MFQTSEKPRNSQIQKSKTKNNKNKLANLREKTEADYLTKTYARCTRAQKKCNQRITIKDDENTKSMHDLCAYLRLIEPHYFVVVDERSYQSLERSTFILMFHLEWITWHRITMP